MLKKAAVLAVAAAIAGGSAPVHAESVCASLLVVVNGQTVADETHCVEPA